jgi:hypothetical protein
VISYLQVFHRGRTETGETAAEGLALFVADLIGDSIHRTVQKD